jgi:DNA primase catalytic core
MDNREILEEIFRLIQAQSDVAFPEFGFKRIANGWEATTGKVNAEDAKGLIFHYDSSPFCFVNQKTGENISLWKYLEATRVSREPLEELARLGNYSLPALTPEQSAKLRERNEKADLLECAQGFFTSELWSKWSKSGEKPLAYLKARGYTEEEIRGSGLGCFPPQLNVEAYLANRGYNAEAMTRAGLKTGGFGTTHTITIPYRDISGRIKGFVVGTIDPNVDPRYKLSAGTEKDELFNLYKARGEKNLIVVEGYLDSLIATARGVKGVVATGGGAITEAQLDTVLRTRERTFIFALNNDPAGEEAVERSLGRIYAKAQRAYVAKLPEGFKDPDQLITKKGIAMFQDILEKGDSGVKWTARRLLGKYNVQTDQGRDKAMLELLDFEDTLKDPADSKDFLDTALPILKIDSEVLKPKLQEYHQRKDQDRLRASYGELLREGQKLLREGRLAEFPSYLESRLRELQASGGLRHLEPYALDMLLGDMAKTPAALRTGYPVLDELVAIPQGQLTIISARPSHGKSAFLMNLFLNAARLYPDKTFVFISYEESRKQIGLKLLNILSGDLLNEKSNLFELENYLRAGNTDREMVEKGKAEYKSLVLDSRLLIIDDPYFVDELADTVTSLGGKHKIGGVFVDYLQKVKIKGNYQTRDMELHKISEKLLEMARSLQLPVVLGAHVGRSEEGTESIRLIDLVEAEEIGKDANLVLGIFNPAVENDKAEKIRARVVDLNVTILKNRNGMVNEKVVLKFDRPLLRITDPKATQS